MEIVENEPPNIELEESVVTQPINFRQNKCPRQEKIREDMVSFEQEYQERSKISQPTERYRKRLLELKKLKESAANFVMHYYVRSASNSNVRQKM